MNCRVSNRACSRRRKSRSTPRPLRAGRMQQTYTILPLEEGETPPKEARGLTWIFFSDYMPDSTRLNEDAAAPAILLCPNSIYHSYSHFGVIKTKFI